MEDDPDEASDPVAAAEMHERWAALLANAAMGDAGAEVLPTFPHILNELTPDEAKMLEWLAMQSAGSSLDTFKSHVGYDPTKRRSDQTLYDVYVDNLERHRLISVTRQDRELLEYQRKIEERVNNLPDDRDRWGGRKVPSFPLRAPWRSDTVRMTQLGKAFVAACSPPAADRKSVV